jgi:hypothetical protein
MRVAICLVFYFVSEFLFSQQPNGIFCRNSSKIYLIGSEQYEDKITFQVNYSILKELNADGIYPKYILLESGHGIAFLLNRYLENGDKELLKDLFLFDTITRNYYTKLRTLNQSLPDSRKFSFVGVNYDYDYEATHLALRYLLLNEREFSDNTMCTTDLGFIEPAQRFDYLVYSFIDQRLSTNRAKEDIDLMVNLLSSTDSMKIIKKMGAKYQEAKLVLKGYLLGKERKSTGIIYSIPGDEEFRPKRERLIEENIYQLFSQDTTKYIFGSFMSYSKLFMNDIKNNAFSGFNIFANSLNYNAKYTLINNKICASVIIYKNDVKRQSKDYGLNKDELMKKYKILEPNKLFIEPYKGTHPMINQILLYSNKPVRK